MKGNEPAEWAKRVRIGDKLVFIKPPNELDVTIYRSKYNRLISTPALNEICVVDFVGVRKRTGKLCFGVKGYDTISIWNCYKPLEEKKTDISIFKEMLKDIPTTSPVDEREKELLNHG